MNKLKVQQKFINDKNQVKFYEDPHATGSAEFLRFPGKFLGTQGVKILFRDLQCYWISDVILSYSSVLKDDFYSVYVILNGKGGCDFYITDGNYEVMVYQEIEFTDLTQNVHLFIESDGIYRTIMLPSEH